MKVTKQETLYHEIMVLLWSTSVAKDSSIVPSLFFSHFFGPSLFYGLFLFFFFLYIFLTQDNALENYHHHTSIYWQLNGYNSILEQRWLYMNASGGVLGYAMSQVWHVWELWMVASPQIRCKLHDYAKQYDNDERVMINGTVESCIAIYLGMAMEMP